LNGGAGKSTADQSNDPLYDSNNLDQNGHSSNVTKSCSINEIPLSPLHVKSLYVEDSPAVVAIDTLGDNDDVITSDFGKKDRLVITDRSSAVFSMDNESGDNSVVCGKNSWCIVS